MAAKKKTTRTAAPRAAKESDANTYTSTRVPNLRYIRQVEARANSTYAMATDRDGNQSTTEKEG